MTKREAAVLEIYTGTVMLEEDDRKYTQQYIEKLLGRSIRCPFTGFVVGISLSGNIEQVTDLLLSVVMCFTKTV